MVVITDEGKDKSGKRENEGRRGKQCIIIKNEGQTGDEKEKDRMKREREAVNRSDEKCIKRGKRIRKKKKKYWRGKK